MKFFEDLTQIGLTCPPTEASTVIDQTYYRIVKQNPAVCSCFHSHKKLNPARGFSNECIARAVSIYDNVEALINGYFKTPAGKGKTAFIGEVILNPPDGLLLKTFGPGHYSWWRSASFDVNKVITKPVKP